jgi:predicted nucleic acid-binding protein
MRWVLDSNVWIEAAAGLPHATRALAKAVAIDWCGFSAISRLEVLGFPNLTTAEENGLLIMLSQFNEVSITSGVIDRAIQLRRQVRMKAPDAIIAATALLQQAEVITRNTTDFKKVAGLCVLDTQSF